MRVPLPFLATAVALLSFSGLAFASDESPADALGDIHQADLSRAISECMINTSSTATTVAAAGSGAQPAVTAAPAEAAGNTDRSLALGRALADLTAAGRAHDAAALERAAQALAALSVANDAPPAARQRREMFLQAARAGRWPMVEAGIAGVRAERLRSYAAKYGADQATLAGAGLWLRLLELSASARCHGGSGPPQGPLLRPAPTQKLRDRLAALQPPLKNDARVQRLATHVESLAVRAVPPGGIAVTATAACELKALAAKVP